VNLLKADVSVEKYTEDMKWKFSDSGFECHDTDVLRAQIRLVYKN
jgi:hypothetical protein